MKPIVLLSICLAVASVTAAQTADKPRYDGTWDTTLSCGNAAGAVGYSFRFPATIKDSILHAEKGTKGQPGWLQIDGKIQPDGTARFYADGLVGASEAAVGHRPAGTEYGYHIDAKFNDQQGTGKRVEGRPCEVTFAKSK